MSRPTFVFAPGAGAPSSSPWMQRFAELLAQLGNVEPFDYPYQIAKRKYPDRLPVLIAAHKAALARSRGLHAGPIVLVGKSMGSRVGCHVALEEPVSALVCLGYPLLGASDPNKMRDDVLRALTIPILFVQGTRDPLCPLPLLNDIRTSMRAPTELCVVEGGDHSLVATRTHLARHATTQEAIERRVVDAIANFLRTQLSPALGPTL